MPKDGELGPPTNPRINRWLEGVETATNEGTLYGREKDKSVVWIGCRPPFLIYNRRSTDDIHEKNQHIEWLDLEISHTRYLPPQHPPAKDKSSIISLPNISRLAGQKLQRATKNKLEVIDLEYRIGTEFMRKDTRMETIHDPKDDDMSDCQVSITEAVNQLSFNYNNDNDDEGFSDDEFPKSALLMKRRGSTGSVNNNNNQLTIIPNTPKELRYETTSNHVRADTVANRDKAGKFSLPPLMNTDGRRHTLHEVPSITVCSDGETTRARKAAQQDSFFDPRFLMPTESSVEEARYMLASRRGSVPSAGRGMRRRSLDMVTEEQSNDAINGDNTMTSQRSLRVPRHRNRSRSLDNSFETNNSFAAFKESLKLRDVKKTRLGT